MFDKEILEQFWKDPGTEEIEQAVKEAYYVFIQEFCTQISSPWKNYLKNIKNVDTAVFKGNLTISDEAYTKWFLKHQWKEEVANAEKYMELGAAEFDKWHKQNKRKGEQMAKKHELDYITTYRVVSSCRGDSNLARLWETIFFQQYLPDANKESDRKKKKRPRTEVDMPFDQNYD